MSVVKVGQGEDFIYEPPRYHNTLIRGVEIVEIGLRVGEKRK